MTPNNLLSSYGLDSEKKITRFDVVDDYRMNAVTQGNKLGSVTLL